MKPTKVAPSKDVVDSVVLKLSQTQLDEFRECFDAFDKDGGGSIDSAELEALVNSLGQKPTPQELAKMVELADADGSGDIDFVEFVTLMAHKMQDDKSKGEGDEDERLKSAFAVFDADGSGTIDSNEMRLVMINLGEEVSKEQVDDVIAAFDEDGDGEISPDEFAAALKAEKLLGTESLDKETGSAGDKAKNRWAGANSYEDVIAQIGVQDESPQAIDRLDGAVMARDSELLAARLKNADRGLLNPTGQLMTYWDFFTLGALFFTATVTPYEVCLMWLAPTWAEGTAAWLTPLFVLNIFVNLIFMVDIVFNFFLPYKESVLKGGGLVKSHRKIMLHYLKGWFTLDIISVIPIDLILMGVDTTEVDGAAMLGAIRMLRLLRLIKLTRILRASRIFSRWENKISLSYGTRSLITLAVGVLLLLHWFACLLGLIAQLMTPLRTSELSAAIEATMLKDPTCSGCTPDLQKVTGSHCFDICLTQCESSTLAQLAVGPNPAPGAFDAQSALIGAKEAWPCRYAAAGKISPMPHYHGELWIAGLYVAMIQLGGGVGSIVPENLLEYIVFFLCILFGSVTWAGVVGTICAVLTNEDPATIEFKQNMDALNYFLHDMNMPPELRVRAREYLRNKRALYKTRAYNEFLEGTLSPTLRIDVVAQMSGEMLTKTVWYLRELEKACIVELALKLQRAVYAPREKIPQLGLNLVMRGVCARAGAILTPGTRSRGAGTWGEDVIVTAAALRDQRPVSALTYVEVALLTRDNFDEVLEHFPESARIIKNAAIKIAMQRAIVVVSAATKALKNRRENPNSIKGNPQMMSLLESGSKGAQLDVEAVIPLLMGKSVKSLDDLEGSDGGESSPPPSTTRGGGAAVPDAQALHAVMKRLDAHEATQKAFGAKLDKVLELLGNMQAPLSPSPRAPRLTALDKKEGA